MAGPDVRRRTAGVLMAAFLWAAGWQRVSSADVGPLELVASFPHQQVTGVAVSREGRIFVNFPNWSDDHTTSVVEVMTDGTTKPFPDATWNEANNLPSEHWVCVQSEYVDDENALWVIDAGAPKMEGPVPGGAKLVRCDLERNEVAQVILFGEDVAPRGSYLNDVRVDAQAGHAYLTDSGLGAIVVVDLASGRARRLLANDPQTKAEVEITLTFDGSPLLDPKTDKTPQIHSDGIALDRTGGYLYFHALTGHTLYRVKTADLNDENLDEKALASRVENVGTTPAADGMLAGKGETILLTALEQNAIVRWNSGHVDNVIKDDRLQWPDSLCWGADGKLYLTASQIQHMPKYHHGQSEQRGPFCLYRLKLEEAGPLPGGKP